MLPRFLVVSKYELKQYRGSLVDEAVVFLVILAAFLMLITPQVSETSLPSSHKIYRVGYLEGSRIGSLDSYTLQFIPYSEKYDMMQDSSLNEIDAFGVQGRSGAVFFGSGRVKSDAALSHVSGLISQFNMNLISDYVSGNGNLSGILLPLRIQIIDETINYSKAVSGEVDAQRRRMFTVRRPIATQAAAQPADLQSSVTPLQVPITLNESRFSQLVDEDPVLAGMSSSANMTLPSELTVEFPFKTLYRNMMLLSPIVMLSILLALSLSRERVDRNIENLFAVPITNAEMLLGKAIPYLALMLLLSLAYGLTATFTLEALKVALVFMALSVTMVSFSMFSVIVARSYRELTFIGSFSMFAFFLFIVLPNVFSGVNVLAFISPLDTVTSIENGAVITYSDLLLSLIPYSFLSLFFLTFTGLCFNAEVISSSMDFRSLLLTFYSQLSRLLQNRLVYVFVSVSLLVPFIFIIESIMAYLVLPLGYIAPVLSLILLASTEEVVKIIPLYYRRMNPLLYGIISGAGFFIMEKMFNLYLIIKVYSFLGGPYIYFVGRLLPTFALHIASTTIFASVVYKRKGKSWFAVGLFLSVTLHVVYNILALRGLI
ncbi:MAG: hypothetical protein V1744_06245 [Candidatus Altiarchaeota archaeon]